MNAARQQQIERELTAAWLSGDTLKPVPAWDGLRGDFGTAPLAELVADDLTATPDSELHDLIRFVGLAAEGAFGSEGRRVGSAIVQRWTKRRAAEHVEREFLHSDRVAA